MKQMKKHLINFIFSKMALGIWKRIKESEATVGEYGFFGFYLQQYNIVFKVMLYT